MITGVIYFHSIGLKDIEKNLIKEINLKDFEEEIRNFIVLCYDIFYRISKINNLYVLQELDKNFEKIRFVMELNINEIELSENFSDEDCYEFVYEIKKHSIMVKKEIENKFMELVHRIIKIMYFNTMYFNTMYFNIIELKKKDLNNERNLEGSKKKIVEFILLSYSIIDEISKIKNLDIFEDLKIFFRKMAFFRILNIRNIEFCKTLLKKLFHRLIEKIREFIVKIEEEIEDKFMESTYNIVRIRYAYAIESKLDIDIKKKENFIESCNRIINKIEIVNLYYLQELEKFFIIIKFIMKSNINEIEFNENLSRESCDESIKIINKYITKVEKKIENKYIELIKYNDKDYNILFGS